MSRCIVSSSPCYDRATVSGLSIGDLKHGFSDGNYELSANQIQIDKEKNKSEKNLTFRSSVDLGRNLQWKTQ